MFDLITLSYQKMGVAGIVLECFAVVAISVLLAKLYQYGRMQLWRTRSIHRIKVLLQHNDWHAVQTYSQRFRHPVAQLVTASAQAHHAGVSDKSLNDHLVQIGQRCLNRLESHLRILDVIANLSPLLGLLGTVLGMISAFTALEAAGMNVDPAILSGGISLALLTTAAGLMVAIPTIAALNYLESIVEQQRHLMTDIISHCLNNLRTPKAKLYANAA